MSGAGEVLVGLAAAASISQLLAYALKTSKALALLIRDVEDAPAELHRINQTIDILCNVISHCNSNQLFSTITLVPTEMQTLMQSACLNINNITTTLDRRWSRKDVKTLSLRRRLLFALIGREEMERILHDLRNAEQNLLCVLTMLNIHISSQTFGSVRKLSDGLKHIHSPVIISSSQPQCNDSSTSARSVMSQPMISLRPGRLGVPTHYSIPWFKRIGLFLSITLASTKDHGKLFQLLLRLKLPAWFARKCLSMDLQFLLFPPWLSHISILPSHIRVQNRIPKDGIFLRACRRGDVTMMRQCMQEAYGLVNSRSCCCGQTPLLLAIASSNPDAVECLLQAGAEPNIGDDSRTLPVFQAVGYKDERISRIPNCPFVQLPPRSTSWLQILKLLARYGASLHESVENMTMTTMNVVASHYDPRTILSYFELLIDEGYIDFNVANDRDHSALWNALRSQDVAVRLIDILASAGVNMRRIFPNGRTALHQAAWVSPQMEPLKYLYEVYDVSEVNRQDQWGCTPLHYAVDSSTYRQDNSSCMKVRYLLEIGANPHIIGDIFVSGTRVCPDVGGPVSPLEYARLLNGEVAEHFYEDMRAVGLMDQVFHDAQEEWTN